MNAKKLIGIAAVVGLGLYLYNKAKNGQQYANATNPDGTKSVVPAWFSGPATLIRTDGSKVFTDHTTPDAYYDVNQYGGAFVGPVSHESVN